MATKRLVFATLLILMLLVASFGLGAINCSRGGVSISPDAKFRCTVKEQRYWFSAGSEAEVILEAGGRGQAWSIIRREKISNDSQRGADYSINWRYDTSYSTTGVVVFRNLGYAVVIFSEDGLSSLPPSARSAGEAGCCPSTMRRGT